MAMRKWSSLKMLYKSSFRDISDSAPVYALLSGFFVKPFQFFVVVYFFIRKYSEK